MASSPQAVIIPVDREHGGLRLVVFGAFALVWVGGYFVLNLLLSGAGVNLIALVGGFFAAYLASTLLERVLKERWRSGREAHIDAAGVRLVTRGSVQVAVHADAPADLLRWHFVTRRRSRVPAGWHVVALGLEQTGDYLIVYTLLSPDQFEHLSDHDRYTRLNATRKDQPQGHDDLVLAGEQRRLLAAEQRRWAEGAEMTLDDFRLFAERVAAFPAWRQ